MLRRPLTFGHHHYVVRIPNYFYATFGHFLVKFVQVDVRQERRQRSPLRGSFRCSGYYSIFHDSGLQVLFDQSCYPFVPDLFPEQFHQ